MKLLRHLGFAALLLALLAGPAFAQGANSLLATDAPSGSAPALRANGVDANISINLVPKGTGAVQINGAPIPSFAGGNLTVTGNLAVTGSSQFTGPQTAQIGTSGVFHGDGGIPIFVNSTDSATTGLVLQTLYTFPLPANSLANTVNQRLRFKLYALTAANANNKTLTITFGATTIFNSTTLGFNNSVLQVDCDLFVTGVNTQKALCFGSTATTNGAANGAAATFMSTSTTPAETVSGAITINVTGTTPTAIGDLTAKSLAIDFYPQP